MKRQRVCDAKRLVIKVGSALLTNDGAGIDRQAIDGWVEQIAKLLDCNKQVVVVSSGAVAEGLVRLGLESRPQNIDRKSTRLNSSHSQQSRMPSSA